MITVYEAIKSTLWVSWCFVDVSYLILRRQMSRYVRLSHRNASSTNNNGRHYTVLAETY